MPRGGRLVKLIDGPYEGIELEARGNSLLIDGDLPDGTPIEGRRASYRPTRNRDEFRFHGWVGEEEILSIPAPGKAA